MATITTPNKSLTLPSGQTYAYVAIAPSDPAKATLLFLHGFPSTSHDWRLQIPYFAAQGYGIIAPDLLGTGQTSKPTNPAAYIGTTMASDIMALVDHEAVAHGGGGGLVGIAHDWGVYVLSTLVAHHGSRFDKFVFVSASFSPPGPGLDYETVLKVNEATEERYGYSCFGYWLFFNSPEAGKVIGEHWESFFDLIYAADPAEWKKYVGPVNALRSFIEADSKIEVASYATPEAKAQHHASFGSDYAAPTCWYKRSMSGLGVEEELKALEAGKIANWQVGSKLDTETLQFVGSRDPVCVAEMHKAAMHQHTKEGSLKIVEVDAGHWIQLEKADVFNQALADFLVNGVKDRSSL
ncbi:hypothetical protein PVAG01_09621 [Phlyctema vagabunda]|uniref:AB hydrolase-1 domain-containing protein n=1 Tax=Phlyctema vagabunda TaxID=108571 RepID=A0ABR4P7W0_9HELO